MDHKELDVWKKSMDLVEVIYLLTKNLPDSEKYGLASQIRRSSKSVKDNIVEGYGRRKYKSDFIKSLIYAHASLFECKSQLETIDELYEIQEVKGLLKEYDIVGAKLYSFISYVENNWKS